MKRFLPVVLCGVLSLCGCTDTKIKGLPEDQAYVQPPDVAKQADASMVRAGIGSRWVYDVEIRSLTTGQRLSNGIEIATYTGRRMVNGINGFVCERRRNKGTEVVSQEIYDQTDQVFRQVATSKTGNVILDPPLTVWKFPARPGDTYPWQGEINIGRGKAQAVGAARVEEVENVTTPAGKFDAWRVDSLITLRSVAPRTPQTSLRSLSWFAPKVGVIQQRYTEGGNLVTKRLVSYTLK